MLNNESQAGTENQQSTGVEETSSVHHHNAKPHVVSSYNFPKLDYKIACQLTIPTLICHITTYLLSDKIFHIDRFRNYSYAMFGLSTKGFDYINNHCPEFESMLLEALAIMKVCQAVTGMSSNGYIFETKSNHRDESKINEEFSKATLQLILM